MRSDSEVLAQIASDVAEIKAAVNKGQSRHAESEPCRADLTPEAAREVVERWRKEREFRADLPPQRLRDVWTEWEERHSGLTDFRGNLYRGTFLDGTRDQWRPMTQLGGFKDPGLWHFRPHNTTWTHVERLAQEREAQIDAITTDLAAKDDSDVTDLRKLEGRVCKSFWNLIAGKANKERFTIPIGVPFRVIYAHPERESVMVEYDGNYGWIPPMQEVEVTGEPPRLNYRYSDVVLRGDVVASIRPESEAFTIATIRLKPLVSFKPERLAVSLSQSARWQSPTKISRAECLDLSHLTIMRIRVGDKDVVAEPMSAWGHQFGGLAWPAVRADSAIGITLAISNSVLDRALPPFGLTKGDLRWVAVRVSLILTGSKLR